ncbi:MAG TPA: saccharopine dehydrogenase NADP-binding domain-containing protein [Thermoleophilaceae bacterium]|nr:saccharopine dehydrogenase NADP-binding domain-containing protein [Thermoleophilaceae bacterium]
MAGRIVIFGATGYTGRHTAERLVESGVRPVLAARNVERVRALGDELGGLEVAVADVGRPESVRDLVGAGDVLVATVGPFTRWGDPAVEAAIAAGAHYLDSTGESAFIRRVFEHFGPRAEAAGIGMVTAFGFDWVPGNIAGALALREAGEGARRVRIGYFSPGEIKGSGGTMATIATSTFESGFAWRDGRLVTERMAKRYSTFEVNGRERPAISVGSSEHFALPRLQPGLREVDSYLGWFGPASRPMQAMSAVAAAATAIPGMRSGLQSLAGRFVKGSTGGPDAEVRAKSGSYAVATAYDDSGRELAEVRVEGGNAYDFTFGILAWGARTAAAGGLTGSGALGPADGFGVDELEAGCREAGLTRVG